MSPEHRLEWLGFDEFLGRYASSSRVSGCLLLQMGPAYETWRKKANNRIVGGQMARAGPLGGEDLPTSAATPSALYLPPEQHAALPASAAVTAVTGYSSSTPLFFGQTSEV